MACRDREFSLRLWQAVKEKGYNNKTFAQLVDISENAASNYLKKGRLPEADILVRISKLLDLSIDWLLTGEEDLIHEDIELIKREIDPEIAELLSMTKHILDSKTDYSASLAANIRSFHRSVELEERILKLENTINNRFENLESKLDEHKEKNHKRGKVA